MKKLALFVLLSVAGATYAMQEAQSLDEQLFDAVSEVTVDSTQISNLISQGANPNYVHQPSRQTPLYLAAYFGNIDAIRELIAGGANPNEGIGALIGVLRGIDDGVITDKAVAVKTAVALINLKADYNAPIIKNYIATRPMRGQFLARVIEYSNQLRQQQAKLQ